MLVLWSVHYGGVVFIAPNDRGIDFQAALGRSRAWHNTSSHLHEYRRWLWRRCVEQLQLLQLCLQQVPCRLCCSVGADMGLCFECARQFGLRGMAQ